jgi:hypothetical protein
VRAMVWAMTQVLALGAVPVVAPRAQVLVDGPPW